MSPVWLQVTWYTVTSYQRSPAHLSCQPAQRVSNWHRCHRPLNYCHITFPLDPTLAPPVYEHPKHNWNYPRLYSIRAHGVMFVNPTHSGSGVVKYAHACLAAHDNGFNKAVTVLLMDGDWTDVSSSPLCVWAPCGPVWSLITRSSTLAAQPKRLTSEGESLKAGA